MEEWDPRDVSFITPPCSLHSFSLSLFLCRSFSLLPYTYFFYSSFPSFIHSLTFIFSSLLPLACCQLPDNLSLFFPPSFAPSLSRWRSFLGFIISSGDIPPLLSPFFPLFLSLSLSMFFLSIHLHFQCRKANENPSFFRKCSKRTEEGKDMVDEGKRDERKT